MSLEDIRQEALKKARKAIKRNDSKSALEWIEVYGNATYEKPLDFITFTISPGTEQVIYQTPVILEQIVVDGGNSASRVDLKDSAQFIVRVKVNAYEQSIWTPPEGLYLDSLRLTVSDCRVLGTIFVRKLED